MKRHILILSALFFFIIGALSVYADSSSTTGFIPGQIWYSEQPLVEGDTVKIHTVVWNGDADSVTVSVGFYDGNVVLGNTSATIASEQLEDVSVSWKVTAGDHTISAKILSSNSGVGNTKKPVDVKISSTSSDHQFVPVAIVTADGTPASSADVIKNQIAKATSGISSVIPNSVSDGVNSIDKYRDNLNSQINTAKTNVQKQIDFQKAESKATSINNNSTGKPLDKVQQPIAYINLFLLTLAGYIFANPLIFYPLALFVAFMILRFIYRLFF